MPRLPFRRFFGLTTPRIAHFLSKSGRPCLHNFYITLVVSCYSKTSSPLQHLQQLARYPLQHQYNPFRALTHMDGYFHWFLPAFPGNTRQYLLTEPLQQSVAKDWRDATCRSFLALEVTSHPSWRIRVDFECRNLNFTPESGQWRGIENEKKQKCTFKEVLVDFAIDHLFSFSIYSRQNAFMLGLRSFARPYR
jgi:hypothetical protein